jgi:hypothetical protein
MALDHGPSASPRHRRVRAHLRFLASTAPSVHEQRLHEVVHVANVLVAGAPSVAPLPEREAMDAVLSTCNLGLESWPVLGGPGGALPSDSF